MLKNIQLYANHIEILFRFIFSSTNIPPEYDHLIIEITILLYFYVLHSIFYHLLFSVEYLCHYSHFPKKAPIIIAIGTAIGCTKADSAIDTIIK